MKRLLKWAVGTVAVLALLVLGAVVLFQFFISSDRLKRLAEIQGEELLGRKVRLERLSVGLFQIEAEGFTVAAPRRGSPVKEPPLLQVRKIRALLNPVALLYRRISVMRLTLDGISLNAARDADGRFNFQDVLDRLGPSREGEKKAGLRRAPSTLPGLFFVPSAEAAEESVPEGVGPLGFDAVIHELDVYDLAVSFRAAARAGRPAFRLACSVAHLEVDEIRIGRPLDLFLDGSCSAPGRIDLKATAHIDPGQGIYRAVADFAPFEVAPFARLAPPLGELRVEKGRLGGSVRGAFSGGGRVAWEADLQMSALTAEYLAGTPKARRRLQLERAGLQGRGTFDLGRESARVERLNVELPFAKGRLTKPLKWNLGGQDEVHLAVDVSDFPSLANWAGSFLRLPLGGLRHRGKMKFVLSAFRDRRKAQAFIFETAADFDPIELAPLARLLPPQRTVRGLRGRLGGKVRASYSSERVGRWDLDLRAEELGVQIRPERRGAWRQIQLPQVALRSAGSFDAKKESVEVARLEVVLPYARARLLERGRWNLSGRDEVKLEVQVTDLGAATALVGQATGFRVQGIPQGTKVRLTAAASRIRNRPEEVSLAASASFDPIEVGPFVGLVSLPKAVRGFRGKAGGQLDLSYSPRGVIRWKTALRGRDLTAEVRPTPRGKWSRLALARAGLRSEGWFHPERGSAEVARLTVELPFAKASLRKKALWNLSGRDEVHLALSITDLSAAEAWIAPLVGLPIRPGKKGETLDATLSATRIRKRGEAFSYQLTARFHPLAVGPIARLASLPPSLRNPEGEVAGKVDLSYTAAKLVRWEADLRSQGLALEVRPGPREKWRKLKLGRMNLRSKGSYDPLLRSAEIGQLEVNLPFGRVSVPKRSLWNHSGQDAIHLVWNISKLADAAAVVGAVAGEPLSRLAPEGTLKGSLSLVRDRRRSKVLQGTGSMEANIRRLHHAEYPNMELRGTFRARFDGRNAHLAVPRLLVLDRRNPQAEPAILLRDLSASFPENELMKGRILARSVLAKYLGVRLFMDPAYQSNLDVLLEKRKPGSEKKAAAPPAAPKPAERRPPKAAKAPAPAQPPAGEQKRPAFLPDVKISRLEVSRLDFQFLHVVERGRPPVRIHMKDLGVLVENFDTRMPRGRLNTRLLVSGRGKPNPLLVQARMNPSTVPPDVEGVLSVQKFDLRSISPYARDVRGGGMATLLVRGTEITSGTLDLNSKYSVRQADLRLQAQAKVTRFNFRTDGGGPLTGLPRRVAQSVALYLLKRNDNTISMRFQVRGRLNDPSFRFLDTVAEALFLSLFEKLLTLGGDVGGLIRGIIGGAVGGISGTPPPPPPQPQPEPQTQQPPPPESGTGRTLERSLERKLERKLRELLGR